VVVNQPQTLILPAPKAIKLNNISWIVLTIPDATRDPGIVYFALTPGDYENLSTNMAEILRWTSEAQWQLNYYRSEAISNGIERRRNQANSGNDRP